MAQAITILITKTTTTIIRQTAATAMNIILLPALVWSGMLFGFVFFYFVACLTKTKMIMMF